MQERVVAMSMSPRMNTVAMPRSISTANSRGSRTASLYRVGSRHTDRQTEDARGWFTKPRTHSSRHSTITDTTRRTPCARPAQTSSQGESRDLQHDDTAGLGHRHLPRGDRRGHLGGRAAVRQRWGLQCRYDMLITSLTTVITFVMVFIIQSTQNRESERSRRRWTHC